MKQTEVMLCKRILAQTRSLKLRAETGGDEVGGGDVCVCVFVCVCVCVCGGTRVHCYAW